MPEVAWHESSLPHHMTQGRTSLDEGGSRVRSMASEHGEDEMAFDSSFDGQETGQTNKQEHATVSCAPDRVAHSTGPTGTFLSKYRGLVDLIGGDAENPDHVARLRTPSGCDFYRRKLQVLRNIDADPELPRSVRDVAKFIVNSSNREGRYVGSDDAIARGSKYCSKTVRNARRHPGLHKYFHCTPGTCRGLASEYAITEFALAGLLIRKEAENQHRGRGGYAQLLGVLVEELRGGEYLPLPPGDACAYPPSERRNPGRLSVTGETVARALDPVGATRQVPPSVSSKEEQSSPSPRPKGGTRCLLYAPKGGIGCPP